MKPGITSKLFFAILLTCMVVVAAMATASWYSFNKGFLGYLNEQEDRRVESLRPGLAKAYAENGNWDFLRGNPRAWFALIRPPGMPGPEEPDDIRRAYQRPESDLTGLNLRVSLLDQDGQLVIGNPSLGKNARMKPINVDGDTVGWVALVPFQQVSTGAAMRFQLQHLKASWVIGAIVVLLAGLVAFLLARMLLAPVKRIAASTHRLAVGDYATRVDVTSRDELGQLAGNFNHLALALEKNEQLRRGFMADVSHELRTPLSVLKAELEAAEDGIRPLTMDTVRSLQGEVATLGKLINDLYELSLSDVGALTYRKRPVDVLETLANAVAAFEERLREKRIHVSVEACEQNAICEADPERLRQLFNNLLENTARYTESGGKLIIRCESDGRTASIHFEDTKPGVPRESLSRIFERFYRVENSRNRMTGGAGLGLAICRNIAEAHDGTIVARSSPLGGLWLTVALPLADDKLKND